MRQSIFADKEYSQKLWLLAAPMILQYMVSASVNLIDNVMVGSLGDVALAAINISNQFFFRLFNILIFGLVSGGAILTAQYWGIRDKNSIHKVMGLQLVAGLGIGILFALLTFFIPEKIIRLYSNDPAVIEAGAILLKNLSLIYITHPIAMIFNQGQRSTGNTRLPMITSSSSLATKVVINYALIFGNFGFPRLGLLGSACATLIARLLECLLMVILTYRRRDPIAASLPAFFHFDRKLTAKTIRQVLPVLANEGVWGLGTNIYSGIYAKISTASIAAVSAVSPIDTLMQTMFLAFGDACAVMVGNQLGRGDKERAFEYARKTIRLSGLLALIVGIAALILRHPILSVYNLSIEAKGYANVLFIILCATLWIRAISYVLVIGGLRSGGDVQFGLITDLIAMWAIGIPVSALLAFTLKLPVTIVFLGYILDEIVKLALFLKRFFTKKWMNTLTS